MRKHLSSGSLAFIAAALLAGCASTSATTDAPLPDLVKKPDAGVTNVHVETRFLTYAQIEEMGRIDPALNDRLKEVAPTMVYIEGQAVEQFISAADVVAFAAKELVNWVGNKLEAEAKMHTAQFGAYIQEPDWWDNSSPMYAAIQLVRTGIVGGKKVTLFDAIVVIKPVMSTVSSGKIASYQLIPVYLLETKPAAEDFGNTMGAVLSIHMESTWNNDQSEPKSAVICDYPVTVHTYTVGVPYYFVAKEAPAPGASKQTDSSHFFAMPGRISTISVQFGVVETDPSKWVGLLEKVGEAIGGQSANVSSMVQKKMSE